MLDIGEGKKKEFSVSLDERRSQSSTISSCNVQWLLNQRHMDNKINYDWDSFQILYLTGKSKIIKVKLIVSVKNIGDHWLLKRLVDKM